MNAEEWDLETKRTAIARVKRLAKMLRQSSAGKAVVFVDSKKFDFADRGCARWDSLHRRNTAVCMGCDNFDRSNLVCRLGRVRVS